MAFLRCNYKINHIFEIKAAMNESKISIFNTKDGSTQIEVKLNNDTVWLNQYQLEELLNTDRTSLNKHISNIYKTEELDEKSTCAKIAQVQQEGERKVKRTIKYYNLDIIIALGYRVNSKRGTEFRKWASKILRDYLVKGYSINENKLLQENKKLKEFVEIAKLMAQVVNSKVLENNESRGLLEIISKYAYALEILDKYDYQTLEIKGISNIIKFQLTYEDAIHQISIAKVSFGNSGLFGHEKDKSFRSSISTIYQSFAGTDLYPSIEEKAANLLYFITKKPLFFGW